VSLLVNGSIPPEATPYFLSAVKPLISQLLEKWEIGNLRRFLPLINEPTPSHGEKATTEALKLWELPNDVDPLGVIVSREDVETLDTGPSLSILRQLTASPATARRFFECVDIAFHGYNDLTLELFEIPGVRDFVYKLDEQIPFWLFFLSKHYRGLQCLLLCFLPPFLTEEGRAETFPEHIGQLLTRRWIPAMNHVCEYVGFSEQRIMKIAPPTRINRPTNASAQGKALPKALAAKWGNGVAPNCFSSAAVNTPIPPGIRLIPCMVILTPSVARSSA